MVTVIQKPPNMFSQIGQGLGSIGSGYVQQQNINRDRELQQRAMQQRQDQEMNRMAERDMEEELRGLRDFAPNSPERKSVAAFLALRNMGKWTPQYLQDYISRDQVLTPEQQYERNKVMLDIAMKAGDEEGVNYALGKFGNYTVEGDKFSSPREKFDAQQRAMQQRQEEHLYKKRKDEQDFLNNVWVHMSREERAFNAMQKKLFGEWDDETIQRNMNMPYQQRPEEVMETANFYRQIGTPTAIKHAIDLEQGMGQSFSGQSKNKTNLSGKIYSEAKGEVDKKAKTVKLKELKNTQEDTFKAWDDAYQESIATIQANMVPANPNSSPAPGYVRIKKKDAPDLFSRTAMQSLSDSLSAMAGNIPGMGGGRSPVLQGIADIPETYFKLYTKLRSPTAWARKLKTVDFNKLSQKSQDWILDNGWPSSPDHSLLGQTPAQIRELVEQQVKIAMKPPKEPKHLTTPQNESESYKNEQWYKDLDTTDKEMIDKQIKAGVWTVDRVKQEIMRK